MATFQAPQTFASPAGNAGVALGDLTGDGNLDMVIGSTGSNVETLLGNGNGTFQAAQTFAAGAAGALAQAVALGDVNGDGKLDIVAADLGGNTVSVLLGNGNGTFQPQQTFAVGSGVQSVAIGDVNDDGQPDVIVANSNNADVGVLLNTASDNFYGQVYTITLAPAITSGPAATVIVGTAGSFTVTASGSPAASFGESGALPAGLTFSGATGVLSGTPATGTAGFFTVVFTASNGTGTPATQTFTLTVDQVPAFTGTTAAPSLATVGTSYAFQYTVTGTPAPLFSLAAGTLPSGLTLSTAGLLAGTPTTVGTFTGVVDAGNGVGSAATETFAIVIDQVPAFTSTSSANFVVGSASEFTVSDTGVPGSTLSESGGLPSGLTFNAAAGILSGTPASGAGGTYNLVFTVSSGASASATQSFTLTVDEAPAFTGTTAAASPATTGTAYTFQYTVTGTPAPSFSLGSGALPSGLTLSAAGLVAGTPTTVGTFTGVVDAGNGVGSAATETFAIVIDQVPAFTSTSSATFVVGSASEFTVSDTGVPGSTLSESGGLPSGLTFNAAAGILSGTPASGAGGAVTTSSSQYRAAPAPAPHRASR